MSARYSKLTTASIVTTEAMLDAEWSVARIKAALSDGLQPHDVPEILAACSQIEQDAAGIREQMAVVADVEMDLDVARRVLNVGRDEVFDERYRVRDRRVRQLKASHRWQAAEAQVREVA